MKRRNFSAEFKSESAQLVLDQNYTVADAAVTVAVPDQTEYESTCKLLG